MSTLPLHQLRQGEPGDRGYILETWLQTYRGSPMGRKLPDWAYWSRYGHVGLVEDLLATELVAVVCLPSSPAFIYGWCCYGVTHGQPGSLAPVLHYVFVRHEFRRQGFGRLLLEALEAPLLEVTHLTHDFTAAFERERSMLFLNPYRRQRHEGAAGRVH